MLYLLANIPWWLTAAVILAGAVMLAHGNRHQKATLRSAGLAVVSIGILLGVAWLLIDTEAEKCERRTRELVASANSQDWAKLQTLLDADTEVNFAGKFSGAKGPDAIRKTGEAIAKQVGLKAAYVISLNTQQTPGTITVTFSAASEQDETQDRPFASGWEFDYHNVNNKWDLQFIKLLSLNNEPLQG